jgi:hypothetical protein
VLRAVKTQFVVRRKPLMMQPPSAVSDDHAKAHSASGYLQTLRLASQSPIGEQKYRGHYDCHDEQQCKNCLEKHRLSPYFPATL